MSLTICENCDLKGLCMQLYNGTYKRTDLMSMNFVNKTISSIKIGPNTSVKLYINGNLTGKFTLFENDSFQDKTILCLPSRGIDNAIGSVEVIPFRQTYTKLREEFTVNTYLPKNIVLIVIIIFLIYILYLLIH